MKIAVNQPNYIPWLGYFDLIDQVDKFIFLDDVQFTKGSFIHRNKIPDFDGKSRWLSLSLNKTSRNDLILEKSIIKECLNSHLNIITNYYRKSPYYEEVLDFLRYNFKKYSSEKLSTFNSEIIKSICNFIGIKCDFYNSSEIGNCSSMKGNTKVYCLIDQFKYLKYYNFSKGVDIGLYDKNDFSKKGKLLYKQDYNHPVYSHQKFIPFMSVVDLLFYELPNSLKIIRRGRNWKLMNPELL